MRKYILLIILLLTWPQLLSADGLLPALFNPLDVAQVARLNAGPPGSPLAYFKAASEQDIIGLCCKGVTV